MSEAVGIVLSGGGARGAYEAGILQGLAEALQWRADGEAPFRVVAGTSVGAINGAWMVANAHRGDHGANELVEVWRSLRLDQHLRVDLLRLMGWSSPLRFLRRSTIVGEERLGRSVLDVRGLENLVEKTIDWERLHQNVAASRVDSFIVAALHVGTGTTAMFAELAPGVEFRPMRHPRRLARIERISAEHVLASAAIPALFPARRIGRSYFVDGGLRFNTPIAPAIRGGAKKLVVVTLKHESGEAPDLDAGGHGEDDYPSLVFLLGKVLNALLLDPVTYDLQVLERFNALMRVLGDTLSDDERRKVDAVLAQSRGMPYRTIDTLVFEPSEDIGVLAAEHLREHMPKWELGRFYEWLLTRAATAKRSWEADLASYLMFDGSWAERLIALGRKDALAKRAEVVDFFAR